MTPLRHPFVWGETPVPGAAAPEPSAARPSFETLASASPVFPTGAAAPLVSSLEPSAVAPGLFGVPMLDTVHVSVYGYASERFEALLGALGPFSTLRVPSPWDDGQALSFRSASGGRFYRYAFVSDGLYVTVSPRITGARMPVFVVQFGARECLDRSAVQLVNRAEELAVAFGVVLNRPSRVSRADVRIDIPVALVAGELARARLDGRVRGTGVRGRARSPVAFDKALARYGSGEGITWRIYDKVADAKAKPSSRWWLGLWAAAGYRGPVLRIEFQLPSKLLKARCLDDPATLTGENLASLWRWLVTEYLWISSGLSSRADRDVPAGYWEMAQNPVAGAARIIFPAAASSIPVEEPLLKQFGGVARAILAARGGRATAADIARMLSRIDKIVMPYDPEIMIYNLLAKIESQVRQAIASEDVKLALYESCVNAVNGRKSASFLTSAMYDPVVSLEDEAESNRFFPVAFNAPGPFEDTGVVDTSGIRNVSAYLAASAPVQADFYDFQSPSDDEPAPF